LAAVWQIEPTDRPDPGAARRRMARELSAILSIVLIFTVMMLIVGFAALRGSLVGS
jgi:hypothetical protein